MIYQKVLIFIFILCAAVRLQAVDTCNMNLHSPSEAIEHLAKLKSFISASATSNVETRFLSVYYENQLKQFANQFQINPTELDQQVQKKIADIQPENVNQVDHTFKAEVSKNIDFEKRKAACLAKLSQFGYQDFEQLSKSGMPPLIFSIILNDGQMFNEVLEFVSDINITSHNSTALFFAVNDNHLEIAEQLLKHNININHLDDNGYSAFTRAVLLNKLAFIDLLLPYLPNINFQNAKGDTALHIALLSHQSPSYSTIKKLLEAKIDPNIKNKQGLNAIQALKSKSKAFDRKIYKLLKKYGAVE